MLKHQILPRIILAGLFMATGVAHADELAATLSDDSINVNYDLSYGSATAAFSWLHSDMNDVENSDPADPSTWKSKRDNVAADLGGFGLYAVGKNGALHSHLGGKLFYFSGTNSDTMHGIAIGGGIDYYFGPNISLQLEYLHAPDIITGGDYNHLQDLFVGANFKVMRSASIQVGYRDVHASFETPKSLERDIFSGAVVGLRFGL